jgi:hypothetical protein
MSSPPRVHARPLCEKLISTKKIDMGHQSVRRYFYLSTGKITSSRSNGAEFRKKFEHLLYRSYI